MAYSDVEDGALKILRRASGYTNTNTSAGNYAVLSPGVIKAVVLNPGAIRSRAVVAQPRRVSTLWEVTLELHVPFRVDISEVAANIILFRQQILDIFDQFPTLNSATGVTNAFITRATTPRVGARLARNWWRQDFILEVEGRDTITIAEPA